MLKNSNRSAAYRAIFLFVHPLLAMLYAALLTGCSLYNSVTQRMVENVTPYRITVVQGNFISREAVAQLKTGMTRAQVGTVLGTPLLTDMFHADRWDYVFYLKRGNSQVVQQRSLTVYFNDDQVTHWTGAEDLPTEYELVAEIDGDKHANTRGKQKASVKHR